MEEDSDGEDGRCHWRSHAGLPNAQSPDVTFCRASSVERRASSVERRASSVERRASSVLYPKNQTGLSRSSAYNFPSPRGSDPAIPEAPCPPRSTRLVPCPSWSSHLLQTYHGPVWQCGAERRCASTKTHLTCLFKPRTAQTQAEPCARFSWSSADIADSHADAPGMGGIHPGLHHGGNPARDRVDFEYRCVRAGFRATSNLSVLSLSQNSGQGLAHERLSRSGFRQRSSDLRGDDGFPSGRGKRAHGHRPLCMVWRSQSAHTTAQYPGSALPPKPVSRENPPRSSAGSSVHRSETGGNYALCTRCCMTKPAAAPHCRLGPVRLLGRDHAAPPL